MKSSQAVQKLLVGDANRQTDTQTNRETGDLITLLSFLESRLKIPEKTKAVKKTYAHSSSRQYKEVND
jgi:hypothetical protein